MYITIQSGYIRQSHPSATSSAPTKSHSMALDSPFPCHCPPAVPHCLPPQNQPDLLQEPHPVKYLEETQPSVLNAILHFEIYLDLTSKQNPRYLSRMEHHAERRLSLNCVHAHAENPKPFLRSFVALLPRIGRDRHRISPNWTRL
jgi:hypothetical protein